MWGTERIWPRNSRVPKVTELIARRPVYAKVGEPMSLKIPPGREANAAAYHQLAQAGDGSDQCDLLPEEVRNPPEPTEEQIRAGDSGNAKEEPEQTSL